MFVPWASKFNKSATDYANQLGCSLGMYYHSLSLADPAANHTAGFCCTPVTDTGAPVGSIQSLYQTGIMLKGRAYA